MNKKFEYLFLLIPLLIIGFTITNKNFSDPNKDRLLIEIIKYVVEKGHYNKIQIDDNLSEKIYLSFIDKLDKQKRFFLKSDLKNFEKYKYRLDDQIKNYDLTFFNLVYETLKLRSNEVQSYYKEILAKPFDFKYKEELNLDFENKDFSKNKSEINNHIELVLVHNNPFQQVVV